MKSLKNKRNNVLTKPTRNLKLGFFYYNYMRKTPVWMKLINKDHINTFAEIFFGKKISVLVFDNAVKSLESDFSEEELVGKEILDVEALLIEKIGQELGQKEEEEGEIHRAYMQFIESGTIGAMFSESEVDDEFERDESDIEGIEFENMGKDGKKVKVRIKLNDITELFGNLLGSLGDASEGSKKDKDDKNSESFYI